MPLATRQHACHPNRGLPTSSTATTNPTDRQPPTASPSRRGTPPGDRPRAEVPAPPTGGALTAHLSGLADVPAIPSPRHQHGGHTRRSRPHACLRPAQPAPHTRNSRIASSQPRGRLTRASRPRVCPCNLPGIHPVYLPKPWPPRVRDPTSPAGDGGCRGWLHEAAERREQRSAVRVVRLLLGQKACQETRKGANGFGPRRRRFRAPRGADPALQRGATGDQLCGRMGSRISVAATQGGGGEQHRRLGLDLCTDASFWLGAVVHSEKAP